MSRSLDRLSKLYRDGYQASAAMMLDAYMPTMRGMPIVRLPDSLRAVTGEMSALVTFAPKLLSLLR